MAIDLPRLWNILTTRLGIRPAEGTPQPSLYPGLMPVLEAFLATRHPNNKETTKDISAASGNTVVYTVPVGKIWRISCLRRSTTTGNSQLLVAHPTTTTAIFRFSASGTAEEIYRNLDLWLREGQTIRLLNTNNPADSAIECSITYEEYESGISPPALASA